MDSTVPSHPAWVQKRDGRLVPFEADKINRAIFAASDSAGRPDAFLARELTDGVLHFLAAEVSGATVSCSQIAETLVKVVRELGQPKIAQAFAEFRRRREQRAEERPSEPRRPHFFGPTEQQILSWMSGAKPQTLARQSAAVSLEQFSLEHVYSRNLSAAHRAGLLQIGGLESPSELAAAVIRPGHDLTGPQSIAAGGWRSFGIFETVEHARCDVGQTLAFDAPERDLAARGLRIAETFIYFRELELAARTVGLQVVLNLGSETPPDWAKELVPGPLFADQRAPEGNERITGHRDALVDQVLQQPAGHGLHLNWHLARRDFEDLSCRQRLMRLARAALTGAGITFVFDRNRQPVSLAEGLDRRHAAVLQWVGLNLPALRQQQSSQSPDDFLRKLVSLVRLAASTGIQKRDFLRRHARRDRPGFLFDRAHLAIHLIGLSDLLESLFGKSGENEETVHAFVLQLLRHVQETLAHEARSIHLVCLIDVNPAWEIPAAGMSAAEDWATDWRQRLILAGKEHGICGRGTAFLPLPTGPSPEPGAFLDLLHFAWKQTAVCRVRVQTRTAPRTQLTATWSR